MSNIRVGTPSGRGKRSRSGNSRLKTLIILLLAAVLVGFILGFFIGRGTAPKKEVTVPDASSIETSTSAEASDSSAEASASTSAEPEPEPEPELEPEPEPVVDTGILVCIDPGHGGNDGGTSDGDRLEKTDNLAFAEVVKAELEAKGINVIMTREEDVYVSLDKRCQIANESHANYLISLHRNSAGGVANGVEIWRSHHADAEAIAFAEHIHEGIFGAGGAGFTRDRGVRIGSQGSENSDLQMNRETDMASVLIEMGFIEMPEDNQYFDNYMKEYGQAMAQAVLDTYAEFHS